MSYLILSLFYGFLISLETFANGNPSILPSEIQRTKFGVDNLQYYPRTPKVLNCPWPNCGRPVPYPYQPAVPSAENRIPEFVAVPGRNIIVIPEAQSVPNVGYNSYRPPLPIPLPNTYQPVISSYEPLQEIPTEYITVPQTRPVPQNFPYQESVIENNPEYISIPQPIRQIPIPVSGFNGQYQQPVVELLPDIFASPQTQPIQYPPSASHYGTLHDFFPPSFPSTTQYIPEVVVEPTPETYGINTGFSQPVNSLISPNLYQQYPFLFPGSTSTSFQSPFRLQNAREDEIVLVTE